MSRTTVEVAGFGTVTFKPLGKLAMERVREAAQRGAPRGYGSSWPWSVPLAEWPAEGHARMWRGLT
jgi:hypothetical protein